MDLKDLKCLIAISEHGSLGRAAEAENMSQPSLSVRIRALEDHFGVALFLRSNKGVTITDEGRDLLRHARIIVRQFEDAEAEMQFHRSNPVGLVRLGLPTSLTSRLAAPILDKCMSQLPNVKVRIVESMSGYIVQWLKDDVLDLGVTFGTNAPAGIDITHVAREDLLLVAQSEAILAPLCDAEGNVPFSALHELGVVLPGPEHGLRALIETLARQQGVRINAVVEIDAFGEIMRLVSHGYGVTVMSSAALRDGAAFGLVGARVVRPTISRVVNTAVSTAHKRSRACREVTRMIHDVIDEEITKRDWLAKSLLPSR